MRLHHYLAVAGAEGFGEGDHAFDYPGLQRDDLVVVVDCLVFDAWAGECGCGYEDEGQKIAAEITEYHACGGNMKNLKYINKQKVSTVQIWALLHLAGNL